MNGVVTCASPECWEDRAPNSRFCQGHLDIFARIRAEVEEEMSAQNSWKKGELRNPVVKKRREAERQAALAEGELLEDELDDLELVAA